MYVIGFNEESQNVRCQTLFASSVDEYVHLCKKFDWAMEGALTHFLKAQRIWIT